jgi:uncharacterized protein (UPF0548 family)
VSTIHLRRPDPAALEAVRVGQLHEDVTYDGVGQLRTGRIPDGYHRFSLSREFSDAPDALERAERSIRSWSAHRGAGVIVQPDVPALEPGVVMALAVRTFGIWITASCRVIEVVKTEHSFGFVYGTLPHHVEQGEESFMAHRNDAGMVRFQVEAFSRPGSWLTRLAGPIGPILQKRQASAYLDGMIESAQA